MIRLAPLIALLLLFGVRVAAAQEGNWGPWTFQGDASMIGAGFKHDDGGSLIVTCDKNKHLMLLFLIEPRAKWRQGDPMELTVRSDSAQEIRVSGGVIGPTIVGVKNDTTWGLSVMGKSQAFFVVGNGEYARVFPMKNFKTSVEAPLHACGDHW